MFIDTHAHLYHKQFDGDRATMLSRAMDAGINKFILPNIDLNSIEGMKKMAETWPAHCFQTIGLHPCDVKEDFASVLDQMEQMLKSEKFYGIGETGLDYYWDTTFVKEQKLALIRQIQWAKKYQLPIILHCRNSIEDVIEIVEKESGQDLRGIFHCFTGTLEQAERIISAGFYLGIGGVVTFKNGGLAEILSSIPLEKMVLETDAPYLAPVPYRGKRNESSYILLIAEKMAEILKTSKEEIGKTTTSTAESIFFGKKNESKPK